MCGLAGSFTQDSKHGLSQKQRLRRARVLEGLLVANASRGTDATGVATVCDDARCIYKKAVPSYQFVDDKEARKHLRSDVPLIIGHTRYGTTGKNTDENAHPFQEGNIIGAHNGVISNYTSIDAGIRNALEVESKDYKYVTVDSQAVFRYLDFVGPGGYIEALNKVRGSAALVWHDARNPGALWLVRHSNPINLAWVPSMNTLFWSSQYDHLSSVLWSAFGDNWYSVGTKEDVLYMFKRKDVLDFDSWDVKFDVPAFSRPYAYGRDWNEFGVSSSNWDDPDDDADVKHPYAVATVTRKDEGKGKGQSGTSSVGAAPDSTSSDTLPTTTSALSRSGMVENVIAVLNRMGVPFDSESPTAESASLTSMSEVEVSDLAPFDDPNCSVCMEPLEKEGVEMGRFYERTGQWVCATCVSFWEDEGQGNLLEMMGHA